MRSYLILVAAALALTPCVAKADSALETAYWLLLNDYGMVMSKAEFCGLSTRFGLKSDVLSALGMAGVTDLLKVELDLDNAHQAERNRLPHECKPDDIPVWADSFARSIDNLVLLIGNGGDYPGQKQETNVPQPVADPGPLVAAASPNFANPELVGTKIFYGSRAGMTLTIGAASGINTSSAVIEARMTEEDAKSFCSQYLGKITDECISGQLNKDLAPSISADCPAGVFQDFHGDWHQFMGPMKPVYGESMGNYVLFDLGTRELADGSMASGYYTDLALFQSLCPSYAPSGQW